MRNTEARITLGAIAARQGDVEQAVHYGERALIESRRSLPGLACRSLGRWSSSSASTGGPRTWPA
jgi:hypothetical protein